MFEVVNTRTSWSKTFTADALAKYKADWEKGMGKRFERDHVITDVSPIAPKEVVEHPTEEKKPKSKK